VERGRHKVRLQNNILSVVFPEFTQIFAELSELVPRTILEHFPLPRMIAALPQEVFVQRIVGLTDPTIKKAKLRRCHQLATQSIGSAAEADAVVWELRYLLSELTRIRQAQEAILTEVQRLCKNLPGYRLLRTIPGIGPVLAAVLLAEIGDIRTFRSSQQLLKLAGLDLAQIQSGEFQGRVRISKRGKPALRAALYQAAMVAVRHGAPFQLKYLRLIQGREQQPGVKRKALVAIGCKLLRIVYHVLKYEEPYRTMLVAQPNTMTEKCRSDNQVGESDAVFTTVRAGACV
jgi:transposase